MIKTKLFTLLLLLFLIAGDNSACGGVFHVKGSYTCSRRINPQSDAPVASVVTRQFNVFVSGSNYAIQTEDELNGYRLRVVGNPSETYVVVERENGDDVEVYPGAIPRTKVSESIKAIWFALASGNYFASVKSEEYASLLSGVLTRDKFTKYEDGKSKFDFYAAPKLPSSAVIWCDPYLEDHGLYVKYTAPLDKGFQCVTYKTEGKSVFGELELPKTGIFRRFSPVHHPKTAEDLVWMVEYKIFVNGIDSDIPEEVFKVRTRSDTQLVEDYRVYSNFPTTYLVTNSHWLANSELPKKDSEHQARMEVKHKLVPPKDLSASLDAINASNSRSFVIGAIVFTTILLPCALLWKARTEKTKK